MRGLVKQHAVPGSNPGPRSNNMNKAERLVAGILALQTELKVHQNRCKHPSNHLKYKLGALTGCWDPLDNWYWTDYLCNLCKKRWREDDQRYLRGTQSRDL